MEKRHRNTEKDNKDTTNIKTYQKNMKKDFKNSHTTTNKQRPQTIVKNKKTCVIVNRTAILSKVPRVKMQ